MESESLEIFNIGIDIVDSNRFSNISYNSVKKVFTKKELNYCNKKINNNLSLAGKFACKEAIIKACLINKSKGLILNDIEILNDEKGLPKVYLKNNIKEIIDEKNINKIIISISHERDMAIGVAIAIL